MEGFKRTLVAVSLTFQFLLHFSDGIIVLNSGNPARFIRGTFMDLNQEQPQFISSSDTEEDLKQDEGFIALAKKPGFMQSLGQEIVTHLNAFNRDMTDAMIVEAQEFSARSALNMCQFARARMTALEIMNTFQSIIVRTASLGLDQGSTSATPHINEAVKMFGSVMESTSDKFNQMVQDLRQFNIAKHGESPMQSIAEAFKDFEALRTAVDLNQQINV